MKPNLVPCPTYYNGIRMRSRTEANYAAWASQWWRWRYEPFAFADEIGQWRFDFELREVRTAWTPKPVSVFVEVKPGSWMIERDKAAKNSLLARIGSAFSTDPDAVCVIEQSAHPGHPVVVRPSANGGTPTVREACWVEGRSGHLVLALSTDTYGWGNYAAAA